MKVDLTVADFADVVVDLYLPDDTEALKSPVMLHPAAWQTNYVSTPGNHVGAATLPVETTTAHRRADGLRSSSSFFVTRVEVLAPTAVGTIVALGDSITDGTHSGIDNNNRWPDYFARRLANSGIRMAVINAGIGGNRILADGTGPGALARLDRDVLAQPDALRSRRSSSFERCRIRSGREHHRLEAFSLNSKTERDVSPILFTRQSRSFCR